MMSFAIALNLLIGIILGIMFGMIVRSFGNAHKDPDDIISEINRLTQSAT